MGKLSTKQAMAIAFKKAAKVCPDKAKQIYHPKRKMYKAKRHVKATPVAKWKGPTSKTVHVRKMKTLPSAAPKMKKLYNFSSAQPSSSTVPGSLL